MGPPTLFTIPVLRYMKTYGLTHEQLAMVSVVQREWAAKNPRATFRAPIAVEDVLNSRMIAYPFRLLQWRLVTDGGGALILVSAERPRLPAKTGLPARHRRECRDAGHLRHSRESGNPGPQVFQPSLGPPLPRG
jgi:acetyl-CoA acetyltransferase